MPASIFLFGSVIDSFQIDQPSDINKTINTIKRIALIFTIIGTAIWVTSYFYFSFLLIFAQRVTRRVRIAYLKAILEQDIAWFDSINP